MLRCNRITDVTEFIALTVKCIQFELQLSDSCSIRRLVTLVISRKQNVREEVLEGYINLLHPPTTFSASSHKDRSMVVGKGLCTRVSRARHCVHSWRVHVHRVAGQTCSVRSVRRCPRRCTRHALRSRPVRHPLPSPYRMLFYCLSSPRTSRVVSSNVLTTCSAHTTRRNVRSPQSCLTSHITLESR